MIISHNREKLINTIIYFVQETSSCNKIKLFKLLYFLDFEHYKQTGRSVTGLEYKAWKYGPVPIQLFKEIKNPPYDLRASVEFKIYKDKRGKERLAIDPKINFDDSHFTKRELRLLHEIADRHAMDDATTMIDLTHWQTQPWHQVYEVEKRDGATIPYEYALTPEDRELILGLAQEHEEMVLNYQ